MSSWNILISDGLEPNGLEVLRSVANLVERADISADDLLQALPDFDALIVRGRTRVTGAALATAPRLKVVGRAGVGVDNIDLQAARARGVTVVNAPAATSLAVAELALGLMFALARSLPRADAALKDGRWLKKELMGIEINGKTLGLVGMGNIGAAVARRAAALGMSILGYDPFLPPEEIARRGAQPAALPVLYARADFISLHIPLTAENRDLIDSLAFAQMKPGVRLVCAARGGIINETALLEALQSGQVAGAALDVFAQEPPGDNPLLRHPNLIASPHIGAQTVEAQARAAEDIAAEVLAALDGRPLRWKVA